MLLLGENMQSEGDLEFITIVIEQLAWSANGGNCVAKLGARITGDLSDRIGLLVTAANDPTYGPHNAKD
jgi:hypothetical protein